MVASKPLLATDVMASESKVALVIARLKKVTFESPSASVTVTLSLSPSWMNADSALYTMAGGKLFENAVMDGENPDSRFPFVPAVGEEAIGCPTVVNNGEAEVPPDENVCNVRLWQ